MAMVETVVCRSPKRPCSPESITYYHINSYVEITTVKTRDILCFKKIFFLIILLTSIVLVVKALLSKTSVPQSSIIAQKLLKTHQ